MTHKLIVSVIVLCSMVSLSAYSFALARTSTSLSRADVSYLRTTLPFLDLTTFRKTSPEIQQQLVTALRKLSNHPATATKIAGSHTAVSTIPTLPFYSQFKNISSPSWQKVSCGIASIAMIIDHYSSEAIVPDDLLAKGRQAGAYIESAGWSHQGLINLAKPYGLSGETISLSHLSMTEAFSSLEAAVAKGPVIASVHYTFEPTNPIPHLVVITGVEDGTVYYSDPAEASGNQGLDAEKFKRAWKKRYIAIYPTS